MFKNIVASLIFVSTLSGCTVSFKSNQHTKYSIESLESSISVTMPNSVPMYVTDKRMDSPKDITLMDSQGGEHIVKDALFYGEYEHETLDGTYLFRYAINDEIFASEMSYDNGKCKEFFVDRGTVSLMEGCGISAVNFRTDSFRTQKKVSISFN